MFNRESIPAAFIIRSPLHPPQVNFVLSPCLLPSWVTKRFKITLLTFETLDLASQSTSVHRGINILHVLDAGQSTYGVCPSEI